MELSFCGMFAIFCGVMLFEVDALPLLKEYDIWGSGNELGYQNFSVAGALASGRSGRVLNFFPLPVEEECLANDGRRKGICMNTYECRIQGGTSYGFCAMGFGVCCVFTATCDQDIYNNITYFVNPHFPDPDVNMTECNLKLRKIDEEISQIRLDFIHFNLGQPNRNTGDCEEDIFTMKGGSSRNTSRFWEVVVTQIPFSQRAPAGCLQYHTGKTGFIRTMNFAENGRHLTNQDYNICIRQERGTCSIVYEPCC
ncbi:CUB domain-containing protein [Oryctes borbonicus]|uniref:CUB domain-containing protein n=1 Tax=Oryctes borbonicus TaxID=1629725 RepID=A0A0T6B605_9SCAR|nr:CUB domain-containing protein [Oryctes borbonicus]